MDAATDSLTDSIKSDALNRVWCSIHPPGFTDCAVKWGWAVNKVVSKLSLDLRTLVIEQVRVKNRICSVHGCLFLEGSRQLQ